MDGKRPGYRGDAAYRSYSAQSTGSQRGTATKSEIGGGKAQPFDAPLKNDPRVPQSVKDSKGGITKAQSDAAKDFKALQQFKVNMNKPNFTPGIATSLLTKVFPGNLDYRKEFLARNPQLLEYFNSLSEEDQKSNATMVALADIMNLDGKTYEDFLAYDKGAPGLKYKGNVGNLEKFAVKDADGNVIGYDYKEKTDGGDGDIVPLYAQLGFPSQAAYLASLPGTTNQQTTTEDDGGLRLAFRADGGPIGGEYDFESARQMYGLGKLVKKVTRSVKKIAKSPIGKAAIIGGLGAFGAGKLGFLSKSKLFGTALPGALGRDAFMGMAGKQGSLGLLGKLGLTQGYGSLMPTALGGIAAASALAGLLTPEQEEEAQIISDETGIDIAEIRANPDKYLARAFRAGGGLMRIGYQEGSKEPVAKKTMPLLDMDGMEKDYRETGGFVDMGRMEKADDVPARLSKNEFVFTADAVRNAGDGSVDKGAEVMYNMMKNLEAGGEVSEESQGLKGARRMFQTSQRLEEVL